MLNEARKTFIKALEEYEAKNPDQREELAEIRTSINEIFLKRKASFLLEDRLSYLNEYLNAAFNFALKDHFDSKVSSGDSETRLFYLKKSKRFILNEQFKRFSFNE